MSDGALVVEADPTSGNIVIPFFDGWKSWLHLVEGAALTFAPEGWEAAGALVYVLWQALERETLASKVGDVLEFATGWFIGIAGRELLRYARERSLSGTGRPRSQFRKPRRRRRR